MSSTKPLVLIIGVTGHTGGDIANGVLATGNFRVAGIVRPESIDKPESTKLKAAGVDIRPGDIVRDSIEKLTSLLQDVDILISTVIPFTDQRPIFQAAKVAGVKRVLPSEFGPFVPQGVVPFLDQKYEIRRFIQDLDLNYTFVHIGWWLELIWPYPHSLNSGLSPLEKFQNVFSGEGDKLLACTSRKSIGELVARIISDPRTLNQVVMAYDVELSRKEAWKIAERITGEDFSDYPRISADEIKSKLRSSDALTSILYGYSNSMHVRGDNTVANAKAGGALDVRELYPDYQPVTAEEGAIQFYKEPILYDLPASTVSQLASIA